VFHRQGGSSEKIWVSLWREAPRQSALLEPSIRILLVVFVASSKRQWETYERVHVEDRRTIASEVIETNRGWRARLLIQEVRKCQ
jgi:hypothetical protein